jgi:hypothetical protein
MVEDVVPCFFLRHGVLAEMMTLVKLHVGLIVNSFYKFKKLQNYLNKLKESALMHKMLVC